MLRVSLKNHKDSVVPSGRSLAFGNALTKKVFFFDEGNGNWYASTWFDADENATGLIVTPATMLCMDENGNWELV